MKKARNYIFFIILSLFLCGCGTKNIGERNSSPTSAATPTSAVLPTPTNTPIVSPTPTEEEVVVAYMNSFEKINCTEIESYVNKEDSIRNSNLLNYGFLTYDAEGNIYYVNENDGNIYKSDSTGENKQQITEGGKALGWLQLKGEWLYFSGNKTTTINRMHLETGEIEQLFGPGSGPFTIDGEKMYFDDRENGFISADLEGKNKELVFASKGYTNLFTGGSNLWIGEMYGTSRETSQLRYLAKFDGEKVEILNQRGYCPLLAGKYLSFVSRKTGERYIYNLETGQDFNLEVKTDKTVVSDGDNFYYVKFKQKNLKFTAEVYRWKNAKSEKIVEIENTLWVYHMFLTPDKLYIQPHMEVDSKQVTQLWYYDLETGEKGQVY